MEILLILIRTIIASTSPDTSPDTSSIKGICTIHKHLTKLNNIFSSFDHFPKLTISVKSQYFIETASRNAVQMLSWLTKGRSPLDYEKQLAGIAQKINKIEARRLGLHQRSRRLQGLWTLQSSIAYTAYVIIWITFLARDSSDLFKWVRYFLYLLAGPFIIYVIKSAINKLYSRRVFAADAALEALKANQRDLIEEFKEKTNYYSTQSVLDRYSGSAPNTPDSVSSASWSHRMNISPLEGKNDLRRRSKVISPSRKDSDVKKRPQTELDESILDSPSDLIIPPEFSSRSPLQKSPLLQGTPDSNFDRSQQLKVSLLGKSPQPQRTWVDRVLDIVIGADENSPSMREALVCSNCQNHNGLAPSGKSAGSILYICPNCGEWNGEKSIAQVDTSEKQETTKEAAIQNEPEKKTRGLRSSKKTKTDGEPSEK